LRGAQFSGAVGGGTLAWWILRYALREILKLIPMVGGIAAGALNATPTFGVRPLAFGWPIGAVA
jgi:uncharacterized membrane protein (Fun14 family)